MKRWRQRCGKKLVEITFDNLQHTKEKIERLEKDLQLDMCTGLVTIRGSNKDEHEKSKTHQNQLVLQSNRLVWSVMVHICVLKYTERVKHYFKMERMRTMEYPIDCRVHWFWLMVSVLRSFLSEDDRKKTRWRQKTNQFSVKFNSKGTFLIVITEIQHWKRQFCEKASHSSVFLQNGKMYNLSLQYPSSKAINRLQDIILIFKYSKWYLYRNLLLVQNAQNPSNICSLSPSWTLIQRAGPINQNLHKFGTILYS